MNWNRILIWSIFDLVVSFIATWISGNHDIQTFLLFSLCVGAGYLFAAFYTMKTIKDDYKKLRDEVLKSLKEKDKEL